MEALARSPGRKEQSPAAMRPVMTAEIKLRLFFGDEAARAILARNILAPVLDKLSGGDPSGLHHRCVLASYIPMFATTDEVCAAYARFGAIEAIAVCDCPEMAVVVFRSAVDAAGAVRMQPNRPFGRCEAVPPLDLGAQLSFTHVRCIAVLLDPPMPAIPADLGPTEPVAPEPESDTPVPYLSSFSVEPSCDAAPTSTTWFQPNRAAWLHGPKRGADGHLRLYGYNITEWRTATMRGTLTELASRRVKETDNPNHN